MTKKQKKQISLGAIVALTAIAVPVATVVSCGSDSKNTNGKNGGTTGSHGKNNKSSKAIKADMLDAKSVNIVSLGDSVAAGYTVTDKKDHRGHLDANGEVTGISYGSYIAKALKKQNKLGDFDNFAIGGATTSTLRNQIDPSFKLSTDQQTRKTRIIDTLVKPEAGETARFKTLESKLKAANLVTISIGANDVLGNIKLGGLTIEQIIKGQTGGMSLSKGMNSLIDYAKPEKEIDAAIKKAKENLEQTVKSIRKLNSKARIVMVGYPLPVAQLGSILKMDEGGATVSSVLEKVDSIGYEVSDSEDKVEFVNGYNEMWDKEAMELTPELFDIHPGLKGYKVLAASVLANISGKTTFNQINTEFGIPSDSEQILGQDYSETIKKYLDVHTPLDSKEAKMEKNINRWDIVKFTAGVVPKILSAIGGGSKPAPSSLDHKDIYKANDLNVSKLANLAPFAQNVFIGLESALTSGDQKVIDAATQDAKFILASLYGTAVNSSLGKTAGNMLKTMVLPKGQLPKATALTKTIYAGLVDAASANAIISKGASKVDY